MKPCKDCNQREKVNGRSYCGPCRHARERGYKRNVITGNGLEYIEISYRDIPKVPWPANRNSKPSLFMAGL